MTFKNLAVFFAFLLKTPSHRFSHVNISLDLYYFSHHTGHTSGAVMHIEKIRNKYNNFNLLLGCTSCDVAVERVCTTWLEGALQMDVGCLL